MSGYYPINLSLKDQKCVVVGGGSVAERKIVTLMEYNACVFLVSPEVTPGLATLAGEGLIHHLARKYERGDVKGALLVIVATNNTILNKQIACEAKEHNCLINVVDCPDLCTFILPSIIRRGDLQITIGTNGVCPALSKKIRKELESLFGDEYEKFLEIAKIIREKIKEKIKDPGARSALINKLVYSDLLELIKENKETEIHTTLREIIPE
ncbi:MAG: bifunctional precorrin-2 dehydrogenase/sirohydrochlorin ferrochelatase [bacterium]